MAKQAKREEPEDTPWQRFERLAKKVITAPKPPSVRKQKPPTPPRATS